MKRRSGLVVLLAGLLSATPAAAQGVKLDWSAAPASLPPRAEMATLVGDPAAAAPFGIGLRLPDGYMLPPASFGRDVKLTVMEGSLTLGRGATTDMKHAKALTAYDAPQEIKAGTPVFWRSKGVTVLQLVGAGPLELHYLNAADDPRGKPDA